ncbi:MAG: TRAP transporter substrate-binding protein [Microvirga sp.]|jgi:TRAP-type transport system periplasmic protein
MKGIFQRGAFIAAAAGLALCATLAAAQERTVTLRLASAFDEKTDMIQAAKKLADLMKERTGGTVDIKIFAGGQMGGEKDNLEALRLGELDIGVFGTFPIVTLAPKYSFFDAPFVFRDKDHVYKSWNSKLGDGVREIFQKSGIHTIGMMGRGYRHLTSNTPINAVDDLKGVKIRMGQSKPFIDAFSQLGAVVVPIALPELFTSLKLGVVSASDGPFDQIYTFKLQEAQKNLAITGHLYATSLWLMNDAAYRKLSPKQREAFDQAAKEALAYGDELSAKSEEALLGKLKEAGMQVTKPDYAPFMAKAKPAIDKLFAELWSVTTADEIANLR